MRPLSRTDTIALRNQACHLALAAAGEGATKAEMLEWVAFYERVQIDGAAALEGVYSAPVVTPLRIVGLVT